MPRPTSSAIALALALAVTVSGGEIMADQLPEPLRADRVTVDQLRNAGLNVRKVFYWEKKDLATYVVLTKHLLDTAVENANSSREDASAYGARVLGLGYDLASMTWPGWDEEGIDITPSEQAAGLAAAEFVVRLGNDHDVDPQVRYNNYWMLGAQRLAAGDAAGATASWQAARELGVHDSTDAIDAWLALAAEVDGSDPALLDTWLVKLDDGSEEAQGQAAQIRTARRVFVP